MDVDYWGVVNGTKAFLPHLIASGDGHVINVSSALGLFSAPGQAAYVSAKFAVRGFSEALRQEMVRGGHPVRVTTVHPGGVKTGFARNAIFADGLDQDGLAEKFEEQQAKTTPQRAAQIILGAVHKNKARVLVGPDVKAMDLVVRLTGSRSERLLGGPVMGRVQQVVHQLMPKR
jgi:short-subunit dehydrogenase